MQRMLQKDSESRHFLFFCMRKIAPAVTRPFEIYINTVYDNIITIYCIYYLRYDIN